MKGSLVAVAAVVVLTLSGSAQALAPSSATLSDPSWLTRSPDAEGGSPRSGTMKRQLRFASVVEGPTRVPLHASHIRIARTKAQASGWYDEIPAYFGFGGWGDFNDTALIAVFYAGDHPRVRITNLVRDGFALEVSLAVAPATPTVPAGGAYAVVAVPKSSVAGVQKVTASAVEEEQLNDLPDVRRRYDPDVTIRINAQPRAGHLFTAAIATFQHPASVLVLHVACRGSLGGTVDSSGEFRILRGARLLRPVIRIARTPSGFVRFITCSWRLPKTARGKLLSLGENNCVDTCPTGFILDYAVIGNAQFRGGGGGSHSGAVWRIAR